MRRPKRPNAVYETMTRWVGNGYVVRVWMDHPHFQMGPNVVVLKQLSKWHGDRLEETIHELCQQFPSISAVEVLDDETGNGALYYPEWP